MENKVAIIAGTSGLIGSHLLKLLLDSDYQQVVSVSRRKLEIEHPKLVQKVVDFDNLHSLENELVGDHVFCCLGSTMKKAGSKEKFFLYDYTYPAELATITLTNGATQFHLVSSLGAKKKSMFFYSRVKGEIEETIAKMDFRSIHIYQPSLLLGERKEFRFGEEIGKYLSWIFYPLYFFIPNYRPIQSSRVSKAMFKFAQKDSPGIFFHRSKEIQSFRT